jgi:hypothetical protein
MVLLLAGCAGGAKHHAPAPIGSVAAPATSSPIEGGTPTDTGGAGDTGTGQSKDLWVRFDRAIPAKQWGDPPFAVSASATPGATISYSASGGCQMQAAQIVQVMAVGTCLVRATASAPRLVPAVASLSAPVTRARPVISFPDHAVSFFRPFALPLGATSKPAIPLAYQMILGAPGSSLDFQCSVSQGVLILTDRPRLPTTCTIEVSAAAPSPNYDPPARVRASIKIGSTQADVHVQSVLVQWSQMPAVPQSQTRRLEVLIKENSGSAYYIEVERFAGPCVVDGVTPHDPSPPGTTQYHASLELPDPGKGSYTCDFTASARPTDEVDSPHQSAGFRVTVSP